MKFIVVLLLALNAFLLSMWTGWFNPLDNREPERLRRQVEAERIAIQGQATPAAAKAQSAGAEPSASATTSPATPAAATEGQGPGTAVGAAPAVSLAAPAAGAVATRACLEFPPMDKDKAQGVEESMKQFGLTVESTTVESNASFMVYLPPSESAKEAQRKLAELKKQGITDAFLLPDGPYKLGISLGMFRAEEGAKTLQQQLAAKGIRSARIAPGSGSRPARSILKATGSEAQLARVRQVASEVSLAVKSCGN